MASASDHVRRDAEHAARAEIRVHLGRFIRRMDEQAKAHIKSAIERAAADGSAVDGLEVGREAAASALALYLDPGEPYPAVEAGTAQNSAA